MTDFTGAAYLGPRAATGWDRTHYLMRFAWREALTDALAGNRDLTAVLYFAVRGYWVHLYTVADGMRSGFIVDHYLARLAAPRDKNGDLA